MNFNIYFRLFLERKTWSADILSGKKLANLIRKKITNGELSLYSHNNTISVKLPFSDLKIKLKAFNNYKEDPTAGAIFKHDKKGDPLVEIYVFELYKPFRNYRGYPIDKLNNILLNFLEKSETSNVLFSALQHELEHALEEDRGIAFFDKTPDQSTRKSEKAKLREYYNLPHEVNARIVQYIYPVNTAWLNDFEKGIWNEKHSNSDEVKTELKKIINKFKDIHLLSDGNYRKFVKGVYTTLWYLWNHYSKQNDNPISDEEIKKVINDLK